MSTSTYKDLEAWQLAMTVAERCYDVTSRFPAAERFAIVDQIRRASISIAANMQKALADSSGKYLRIIFRSLSGPMPI